MFNFHHSYNQFINIMSDIMSQLMVCDSKRMDHNMFAEVPWLIDILQNPEYTDKSFERMMIESGDSNEQIENYSTQKDSTEESVSFQSTFSTSRTPSQKLQLRQKSRISSKDTTDSESVESSDLYQNTKRKKSNSSNSGYPTKNFLANAKKCHYIFLDKKLGAKFVNSIPFAADLRFKSGISLKDYEILYQIPEFQQTFEEFFACKELYRYLMLSRSILPVKLIHIRKMHLFLKAFLLKEFTHIN